MGVVVTTACRPTGSSGTAPITLLFALAVSLAWATTIGTPALAAAGR